MVVKINFHGGKNQFSSPVTPANFPAGYACTGNALIWLAGIRGKTCSLATEQVLPRTPANSHRTSFTANASQSNESVTCARGHWTGFTANTSQSNESVTYLCTRSGHRSLQVSQGKLIFITVEI